ncbi:MULTISPECIES: type II toxin-antitoxin system RelE/ParE family toxin [Lacticaseibacillus]|uniref:Type II toxin-antitoxin system RelE/ParE family toxin n=2 Tax=Lacticaseibacillus zeae TaxID=57037 RepID=A0A5R8M2E3_LACZE|nr:MULTISPECIES: type II toxin-antitoxin system RelE/ParE family toxin [Lacticaseibacillus]OFR97342.1 addiction module toxin RelE [Lactobacillus sp. HMSC068F07]KLI74590.1 toxin RelE [Lacticaseibacillus casei]MDE3314482.1 type II toxin-antitoxin system RelE/ParE family toxin [Lacticaseibacillus zeae]OLS05629.1 addiction module toxin RelE [Lacticaseibacillus casei]QVI32465.1 type II toxin-antitoxin system RelE/ParE family toxin [Lacticaseibacillus zeae]
MYEVDFYEDKDGYSEIHDFLDRLNDSAQKSDRVLLAKTLYQIDLLEQLGPNMKMPQARMLKGYSKPLFELRPMPERIFYAAWNGNHYILLHHYTKRQNKTDRREIQKALSNLEDWLKRKEN